MDLIQGIADVGLIIFFVILLLVILFYFEQKGDM